MDKPIRTNLGAVTAYADAVKHGYTGTREEFGQLIANFGDSAKQVADDAAEVRQNKENIESMEANVENLQAQAAQSAQEAEESKTQAAGYASAAEASRQAAAESEANVNAQVTGFDEHVAEKTASAETDIENARIAANKAVVAQQEESVQEVKNKTSQYVTEKQSEAEQAIETKAQEYATSVDEDIQAVNNAGTTQVGNVNSAGDAQVQNVKNAGAAEREAAIKAVQDEGAAQKQAVTDEGALQVQAVENKGNEVLESIPEDYTALQAQADGNTEAVKDLTDKKITKFYASNLGETTLNDSDDGKIADMKLYGKGFQKQYTGKNLLNPDMLSMTTYGITFTNNGDGTYTLNGTASSTTSDIYIQRNLTLPKGTYKIIDSIYGTWIQLNATTGTAVYTSNTFELEEETTVNVRFGVNKSTTFSNAILKVMITTDLTATYDDFEPYVGGIPSPNPDYPQEIQSVVNPVVKVCGGIYRNLLTDFQWNWLKNQEWNDDNHIVTIGTQGERSILCVWDLTNLNGSGFPYAIMCDPNTEGYKGYHNSFYSNYVILHSKSIISSFMGKYDIPLVDSEETIGLPDNNCSATLPYTLNAIPVDSGGNITIDGQEYISDYVDVERGKLVRCVWIETLSNFTRSGYEVDDSVLFQSFISKFSLQNWTDNMSSLSDKLPCKNVLSKNENGFYISNNQLFARIKSISDLETFKQTIGNLNVLYKLATPIEIDLTDSEIQMFRDLATHYPTTNVFVTSDQLDGYTEFNYPLSMENGWNLIKEQLGDTRDYIYDMDLQSAEAYVNSEYAVALAELEV